MATRKLVPRADNEGGIGTALKRWASGFFTSLTVGGITFPEGGLPKFSAHKNGTNQTGIQTATYACVTFPTEEDDVGSCYSTVNSAWTPGIVGKAHISAAIFWTVAVDQTPIEIIIYKNNVAYKIKSKTTSGPSGQDILISCDVKIDAVTDYFQIFAYQGSGGDKTIYGPATLTWFTGHVLP